MVEYGLCSPEADKKLDKEMRVKYPNYSDAKILKEVNKIKKTKTLFNAEGRRHGRKKL